MPDDGVPAAASPPQQLARLMDGYLISQLLYVTAKLGIAEELAEGPRDTEALARAVGAQPDGLRRVLRGLAAEGVLDERHDGSFSLTALGTCLRGDVPGSLLRTIIGRGEINYGAAAGLFAAVQHGGAAFERVHGLAFFEYLNQHPERGAAFQAAMTDRSRQEAADVVTSYNFGNFKRLVDVGGGYGILLETILRAAPQIHGVILDQPPVVEGARERLGAVGLADRCSFEPGDFFAAVPPGGDAYLLSRVVHDWDDDAALRILTSCRAAMGGRGILLLVEAVLPELAREQPAAIRMDLSMLVLLHGRERTGAEYERLLRAGGPPAHAHRADRVACRDQRHRGDARDSAEPRRLRRLTSDRLDPATTARRCSAACKDYSVTSGAQAV